MNWLRRGRDLALPPDERDPADDPDALRADLATVKRHLNRNAGRIPVESVVTALCVVDTLGAVLDTAADRTPDIHTVVSVERFVNDYLPTTLRNFLAVAEPARDSGGMPAAEALREQLESLLEAASALLTTARSYGADAMLVQSNFLNTKFSRSDLDL